MFAWRNLSSGNLMLALEWLAKRREPAPEPRQRPTAAPAPKPKLVPSPNR